MGSPKEHAAVLIQEAVKRHREGDLDRAESLYRDVLEGQPSHPQALNLMGVLQYQRGDIHQAAVLLEQAIHVNPKYAEAHNNLGNMLRALDQRGRAMECYRKALEINPDYPDAYNNLGNAFQEQKEFDKALECYQRVLRLSPRDPRALNNLGNTYQRLGQLDNAELYFRQALKLCPDMAQVHSNLGSLLQKRGKTKESIESLHRAVQLNPQLHEAWYNLGAALRMQGSLREALQAFKAVLQLVPHHPSATHHVDALEGNASHKAPPGYVSELFDDYAATFDRDLVEKLGYQTPERLAKLVRRTARKHFFRVLDLGCGTGLAGEAFRGIAGELVGVDLSQGMLDKARERGIYHQLLKGDIVPMLDNERAEVDLAIAADVLIYFGDLVPVMRACALALKPGGLFAFSLEMGDAEPYRLDMTGRFQHGPDYLDRVLREAGLKVMQHDQIVGRKEKGRNVLHDLYVVTLG